MSRLKSIAGVSSAGAMPLTKMEIKTNVRIIDGSDRGEIADFEARIDGWTPNDLGRLLGKVGASDGV